MPLTPFTSTRLTSMQAAFREHILKSYLKATDVVWLSIDGDPLEPFAVGPWRRDSVYREWCAWQGAVMSAAAATLTGEMLLDKAWASMASAPRDGRRLIAWNAVDGCAGFYRWQAPPVCPESWPIGWRGSIDVYPENSGVLTHWMPAPEEPSGNDRRPRLSRDNLVPGALLVASYDVPDLNGKVLFRATRTYPVLDVRSSGEALLIDDFGEEHRLFAASLGCFRLVVGATEGLISSSASQS